MEHGGSFATANTQMKVGEYLRRERLARNVTLDEVEARTKFGRHLLEDLERNNLKSWPRERFYRENFLRAYAAAIGLDPREVVERFREEFPVADRTPATVSQAARRRSTWITIGGLTAACIIGFAVVYRQMGARSFEAPAAEPASAATAGEMNAGEPPDVAKSVAIKPEPLVPPASEHPVQPEVLEDAEAEHVEGELLISSDPPGAHVTVNGIGRGRTPVRVQFLPPGTYTIRFVENDHQIEERRVTIRPDRRSVNVAVTLRPQAEAVAAE